MILSRGGTLELALAEPKQEAIAVELGGEIIQEQEWKRRERANLVAALAKTQFRVSGKDGAAELLGIPAATLTSRMKAHRIER